MLRGVLEGRDETEGSKAEVEHGKAGGEGLDGGKNTERLRILLLLVLFSEDSQLSLLFL